MKLNFKKIASILFIFSILLSTLQITALTAAESPIKIQVGGTLSKLEDAVETANNKGSAIIEIIDNISVTNNIVITSDITLVSANGNHIISVSPSGSIIVKNGNLIIGDDAKTDLLTILSSDETVHVESGTIHIKDGSTVSANGNNCKAIHVDNGDVMVSGGTVSATGDYCTAIEVITGNVIVSGGEIIASMDIGHCCYAICLGDWQNTVSGTVTITGGNVLASSSILGDSFAISLQMGGLAAYLKGTCTGDFEVWGSGIIVEVNSLEIPSVYGGTSNGLNHIEGIALTNVKWDLSGTNPVINFNNEQYKAEWISLNVEPPVTSVGKPVRIQNTGTSLDGELFDTISEAITTAESAGFNTFTLEIIGDVTETNNVVVTSNITIIGAEGAHIFTMSYSQQSLRFSVEGGGSLTLGDGTNANTLTISHSVRVTNGSINVKDGIIVISNGNALFLSGLNVTGVINGGRFEGGESALSMEGGAQLNEISDGVFIGKIDAVHLSDAGTKIDKISGGFFYQTDDSVTRHGHSIFVQNYAQIGEISGGYFDAARNCALVLIRGGKVGEISGGDFIVHRIGTIANNDRNAAVWIENGWESEGFQGTGIGTISGGHFVGTNFGVLAIADYSYAYINYITGGLFEGTVALQNDRGSTITEISGGQFKGSQGLLNNGRIEKISGDADILGTGSYGIYNYAGGQINEINGGKIVSSATLGYGIANSGIINLISGGTIIGDNYAINCAGMNPGRLNVVSGGVFLSKRSYAITLAYPLQLEPGLSGSKGLGRYQSGNGNIFNDESLVIYPKGYQMSSTSQTEPVVGINGVEFRYLKLGGETYNIIYVLVGGTNHPDNPTTYLTTVLPCQIKEPTRNGYTFMGWSVIYSDGQLAATKPTTVYAIPENTTGTVTLYAHWLKTIPEEEKWYTITYNANNATNGQPPTDPQNPYQAGSTATILNQGNLTKEGYTFQGWTTTNTTITIVEYKEGDTFVITQNIILYAVWKADEEEIIIPPLTLYTVTFHPGAHGTFKAQITSGLAYGDLTPNAPVVIGELRWVFVGWTPIPTLTVTGDVVYVAQWEQELLIVTFVDWNGTVLDVQQVPYGGNATAPADPTREGYTFIGWDKSFTNVTTNLTVTALYNQNNNPGGDGEDNDGNGDTSDNGNGVSKPKPSTSAPAIATTPPNISPSDVITPPLEIGKDPLQEWAFVNLVLSVVGLVLAIIVVLYVLLEKKRKQQQQKQQQTGVKGQNTTVNTNDDDDDYEVQQKQRRKLWLIASFALGVAGIIVFLLTENMNNPMTMVDKWTIINAIIFVIELVAIAFIFKRKKTTTETNEKQEDNTASSTTAAI